MLTYEYALCKKERCAAVAGNLPKKNSEILNEKSKDQEKVETNFIAKIEKLNFALPSKKEKKIKKNSATIWISEDFPLKFNVFI